MIIARDIHLWQQDPVKTEECCYWELLPLLEKNGDAVYIAYPWAAYLNGLAPITVPWIPAGRSDRIFTVCQHVRFRELIPLLKNVGVTTLFTPHATLSDPEIEGIQILGLPHWPECRNANLSQEVIEPKYLYSFMGEGNHTLRNRLKELSNSKGIIKLRNSWHFKNTEELCKEYRDEYIQSLVESEFILCPRGAGPSSLRIWEALANGRIPVVIADDLRLPEGENWERCVIRIKEENVEQIPEILSGITDSNRESLRENAVQIGLYLQENFSFSIKDWLTKLVFPILMKPAEITTILKYLSSEHNMLEWGSGGSTVHFASKVKSYVSIEHQAEWFDRLKAVSTKTELFLVDLDSYVEFPKSLKRQFNRVMIDGRSRVECAEELIRADLLMDDALVFLHDWNRERYHSVLSYYEVVEEIRTNDRKSYGLAVLRPKKLVSEDHGEGAFQMNYSPDFNPLLVFLCDQNYADATVAAVQSAIENGKWSHEIVCLVYDEIPSKHRQVLKKLGVRLLFRGVPEFVGEHPEEDCRVSIVAYCKLWIFLDPFFRDYSHVLYFDSDTLILSDLRKMVVKYQFTNQNFIGFRHNRGKGSWHSLEFSSVSEELCNEYPNHNEPIGTCSFFCSTAHLPPVETLAKDFSKIYKKFGHLLLYRDQSLMGMAFYGSYFILDEYSTYDPTDQQLRHLDFAENCVFLHTCHERLFSKPQSPYYEIFLGYYARARKVVRENLDAVLKELFADQVVRNGPFKGLRYTDLETPEIQHWPKLLGSYEKELQEVIEFLITNDYQYVVNIGCGEGYYAVGLAMKMPNTQIIAFEENPWRRKLCQAMATANGVEVDVRGRCSEADLFELNTSGKCLFLCDCEGGENELFDRHFAEKFAHHDFLIETHDFRNIYSTQNMCEAFGNTHRYRLIESMDDMSKAYHYDYPELEQFNLEERYRIVSENRPRIMKWLFAESQKTHSYELRT